VTEHAVTNVLRIDSRKLFGSPSGQTDLPTSFITLDGLRRRGLNQIPSGWLLESSRPLTSEQIADARDLTAAGGLTIETRRESASFTTAIAIATAAGALLALAILAMTVGLIRSESAGDLRTLTATGATGTIRRTLTAATAGALALLGALLGVAGAYVVLAATYYDDLGYLGDVPVVYLVLAVLGVPLRRRRGWVDPRRPRAVSHHPACHRVTDLQPRSASVARPRSSLCTKVSTACRSMTPFLVHRPVFPCSSSRNFLDGQWRRLRHRGLRCFGGACALRRS
jgi:hypothetical protein